jgi:hypothetical protein
MSKEKIDSTPSARVELVTAKVRLHSTSPVQAPQPAKAIKKIGIQVARKIKNVRRTIANRTMLHASPSPTDRE